MNVLFTPHHDPCAAIRRLAHRVLGERAHDFEFELVNDHVLSRQAFTVEAHRGVPIVRASEPICLAAGLHWYLKHVSRCHLSWCGDQLALPSPLPDVTLTTVTSPFRYRYCFNYCTFSYSMAWWDWPRWEREIDWMALAGINLPLAITGMEAVWQRVYHAMGLTDHELDEFFPGPAFLAWGAMGNLDGWGGPLTQSWLDRSSQLQQSILARQRELGMTPVLPAFTGHVPGSLVRHFPDARIRKLKDWASHFPGTHLLDPEDPLFHQIGEAFLREQTRMYGTDHFYSCDCFNENSPPSSDLDYLRSMNRSLYEVMARVDPEAHYVMQGWLFFFNPDDPDFWQPPQIKAFLQAVPPGKLIVLDLHSEKHPIWNRTEGYYGVPWIWNVLHGFGGNRSMYGNLRIIAKRLHEARHHPQRGELQGMGMATEGIGQNPVLYDLTTDLMWLGRRPRLDDWIVQYARRRYGQLPNSAVQAWQILERTAYRQPESVKATPSCLLTVPPRLEASPRFDAWYPLPELAQAWELLFNCASVLRDVDPWEYDLVDVGRQVLSNLAPVLLRDVKREYDAGDRVAMQAAMHRYLVLILDADELLATRRDFLLGCWLRDARACATSSDEADLCEWNARTQITMWGRPGGMLRDYARKEWSGLLRCFYYERWSRFFAEVTRSLDAGMPLDTERFQRELCDWECAWARRTDAYPHRPCGDAVAICRRLLAQYAADIRRATGPSSVSGVGAAVDARVEA